MWNPKISQHKTHTLEQKRNNSQFTTTKTHTHTHTQISKIHTINTLRFSLIFVFFFYKLRLPHRNQKKIKKKKTLPPKRFFFSVS